MTVLKRIATTRRRGFAGRIKSEKGISLIETICAVAILGIIAVAFLSGLATTSTARATNEERTSAKILAESIIENIKTDTYSLSYEPVIPPEFPGYTASVTTTSERNGNIQKIVVTIHHQGQDVLSLESYKVDRSSLTVP
jgi:prepilin-type N-terminal cleavage/methylation domain-containing protein